MLKDSTKQEHDRLLHSIDEKLRAAVVVEAIRTVINIVDKNSRFPNGRTAFFWRLYHEVCSWKLE